MKLSVLALDYDGTLTRDERLAPSMTEAIADARRRGVAVMLVTGRRLDDLRRVAGDLHFVDGVVAENGALVHFPGGGLTTTLAPPIPPAFVARLCWRRASISARLDSRVTRMTSVAATRSRGSCDGQ